MHPLLNLSLRAIARRQQLPESAKAHAWGKSRQLLRKQGQMSLLDDEDDEPAQVAGSTPPVSWLDLLHAIRDEEEAIRTALTVSQEDLFGWALEEAVDPLKFVLGLPHQTAFSGFGMIRAVEERTIRRGRNSGSVFLTMQVSDWSASCRALCWPEDYRRLGSILQVGACLMIDGYVQHRVQKKVYKVKEHEDDEEYQDIEVDQKVTITEIVITEAQDAVPFLPRE